MTIAQIPAFGSEPEQAPEELFVTANRSSRTALDLIGNTAKISSESIRITNAQHIYELGVRATGTWISRGSGQENLTAIRSPVLTGPGACGAFLFLEDSIPIRPTGFCNVNELFEIPSELANAVEILRGPSNALFGSNGLHGTINVLMPEPGGEPAWNGSLETGPDNFWRAKGGLSDEKIALGILADNYSGWRESSGYDQQKVFFRLDQDAADSTWRFGFDYTSLNQDTAGFIRGEDAYKDSSLRKTNPDPDAFRNADSQRFYARWMPDADHALAGSDVRFYARNSDMEFLQHFLPGKPLEENGQISSGIMASLEQAWGENSIYTVGLDLEVADGYLKEFQQADIGSPTRPQGLHYDYDVFSIMAAPFAQLEHSFGNAWTAVAGLRLEYLLYDYDNRMLDGNTADNGAPCAEPCLFSRPADRTDDFLNLAPNIGLNYRFNPSTTGYLTLSRGFAAPQVTELYRLQSGQSVADLDTETLDSLELGVHWSGSILYLEAAGFGMLKRNSVFRDANGFNLSDGKTRHYGIEAQADLNLDSGLYAGLAATYARHEYNFNRDVARGEMIRKGNDVDTAPRTMGSLHVGYDIPPGLLELEWVHMGSYQLNAANTAKYDGHDILNLRGVWRIADRWAAAIRLNNIADDDYADRADFAFGSYRYLPARGRELFLEISYQTL
jgi:iron complex outermembrane receptor protein